MDEMERSARGANGFFVRVENENFLARGNLTNGVLQRLLEVVDALDGSRLRLGDALVDAERRLRLAALDEVQRLAGQAGCRAG